MPIPAGSTRAAILAAFPGSIAAYNAAQAPYNRAYGLYVGNRAAGLGAAGNLAGWLGGGGLPTAAATLRATLIAFGMDARRSHLVAPPIFTASLAGIPGMVNIACIATYTLASAYMIVPFGGTTPRVQLETLFAYCAVPGTFSLEGGYVIASKVAHLIFPDICPMLDGKHTAISMYNVAPAQYSPPGNNWVAYLGRCLVQPANPSPRGAGRNSWDAQRFVQAIAFYARIYQEWQAANGNPGLAAFLALDAGAISPIRVLDKVFW